MEVLRIEEHTRTALQIRSKVSPSAFKLLFLLLSGHQSTYHIVSSSLFVFNPPGTLPYHLVPFSTLMTLQCLALHENQRFLS